MGHEQLSDHVEDRAAGNSDSGADLGRRRCGAVVPRPSDALRTLRVRDGWQSRRRRAGRYPGQARDPAVVRAARRAGYDRGDRLGGVRRAVSQEVRGAVMSAIAASEPLAELRDIRKAFGGIHAVDGVSINLYAGEVVAVLGHNGAGKSTLMKMLAGAYPIDSG